MDPGGHGEGWNQPRDMVPCSAAPQPSLMALQRDRQAVVWPEKHSLLSAAAALLLEFDPVSQ